MVSKSLVICLFVACASQAVFAVKKACYDKVGCFDTNSPFGHLPLPLDPYNKIPPIYYLHRNGQPVTRITDGKTLASDVFVLVHGFTEAYNKSYGPWMQPMIERLWQVKPNADVIVLDWEKGAAAVQGFSVYNQAASNTRTIGAALAVMFNEDGKSDHKNYHCIGFSLGSHVCGFAGKRMTQRFGRISALDPAAPSFSTLKELTARVAVGDADFVDVIHTSRLGIYFPVGDSDFWMNNIKQQPGCYDDISGIGDLISQFASCSHVRATALYTESINPVGTCNFLYCPCETWSLLDLGYCLTCPANESAELGYRAIFSSARGEFYGKTTGKAPYCLQPSA